MQLNKSQLNLTAKFFTDLAKVWFASGVIGFFFPGITEKLGTGALVGGMLTSIIFLVSGIIVLGKIENNN